jgi:hypothetical protein
MQQCENLTFKIEEEETISLKLDFEGEIIYIETEKEMSDNE